MKLIRRTITFAFCSIAICFNCSCSDNELFDLSPNAEAASTSYENQFKAIWAALDLNYPLWDYERDRYGLDWDAVFDEYLPKFTRLDSLHKENGSDEDYSCAKLYKQLFSNLHDGHIQISIKDVYKNTKNIFLYDFGADSYSPRAEQIYEFLGISRWVNIFMYVNTLSKYTEELKMSMISKDRQWVLGQFKDDILYFSFRKFNLSSIMENENGTEDELDKLDIWKTWFSCVQTLHNVGNLKGIILDLRNNEGGIGDDYQYFLGALHDKIDTEEGIKIGFMRLKNGNGRYEYSDKTPLTLPVYKEKHASITAPIVILADSSSRSAAEQTCLAAKKLPNAVIIGTRTWGGYSPLVDIIKDCGFTFAGNIGDPQLEASSFYIKMPFGVFISEDGDISESVGVKPDIEVVFDTGIKNTSGRDNQLDRALQYIRMGK